METKSSLFICLVLIVCAINLVSAQCGCRRMRRDTGISNGTTAELEGTKGNMVEGDMIFSPQDYEVYAGFRASASARNRWPNGLIPVSMARVSPQAKNTIRSALSALSRATNNCVKFKEISGGNFPHVTVFHGGGCYSQIGRTGRIQDLSLGRGCLGRETIQHEFIHALGFYHEQIRPDRDRFVRVNWNNIVCSNFSKCRGCVSHTPYDIKSIMQYQGDAFSCNGRPTMTDMGGRMIRRNKRLTQLDIAKIKRYYGC